MKHRFRYLSAVCINLLLPWLAFRLAAPHWGHAGGLLASAAPLVAWMIWDLMRHRHFDALSAIVLIGIMLSLAALPFTTGPNAKAMEQPMVSGMIGLAFLVSLALPRPLVFYLARSTMARESLDSAQTFEQDWRQRPYLNATIRTMTLVWGISLTAENALRIAILWHAETDPRAILASLMLRYGVYGGLMIWTIWRRIGVKREAGREAQPTATDTSAQ